MANQPQKSEEERFSQATGAPVNLGKIDFKLKIDLSEAKREGGDKKGGLPVSPSQAGGQRSLPQYHGSNLGAQMHDRGGEKNDSHFDGEEGDTKKNSNEVQNEVDENDESGDKNNADSASPSEKNQGSGSDNSPSQKKQPDTLNENRQNEASQELSKQRRELQQKKKKNKQKEKGKQAAEKKKKKTVRGFRNALLRGIGMIILANIQWILIGGFVILTLMYFAVEYPRTFKAAFYIGSAPANLTLKAFELFYTTFGS